LLCETAQYQLPKLWVVKAHAPTDFALVVKDFLAKISLMQETSAAEARASAGRQGRCVRLCLWHKKHNMKT
jgi:hypothetical protein